MHTFCHDSLQQTVASISSSRLNIDELGKFLSSRATAGEGRGLNPEWSSIGYGGAEQFWRGSWTWLEDSEFTDDENSSRPGQWDFLVCDPNNLEHYEETLQTPPATPFLKGRPPAVVADKKGHDILNSFPSEIIETILSLLPTESVNALRLVSRYVAAHDLSSTFWQSRFCYPHELSHIPVSSIATPCSPELRTDWKLLYSALLWPEYEKPLLFLERPERSWKNRSRIARTIRNFAVAMLGLEAIEPIAGWGQHILRETGQSRERIRRKVLSCNPRLVTSRDSFSVGSFHPASPVKQVSVGFEFMRAGRNLRIIDCIQIHSASGQVKYLGRRCDGPEDQFTIQEGQTFAGFGVGITDEGFGNMRIITSDRQGNTNARQVAEMLSQSDEIWGVLSLSPGATLEGIETTFFGDYLTSLTFVEKLPASDSDCPDLSTVVEPCWTGPVIPQNLILTNLIYGPSAKGSGIFLSSLT